MLGYENNELVGAGSPTQKPQAVDLREGRGGLPIHAGGRGLVKIVPLLMGMFSSCSYPNQPNSPQRIRSPEDIGPTVGALSDKTSTAMLMAGS